MTNIPARVAPHPASRHMAATLWILVAAFIIYGSFGASSVDGSRAARLPGFSLADLIQNVLLYIPFGVLGIRTLQSNRRLALVPFLAVTGVGLACSAVIEALQLLSAFRIGSVLDVAANVAGTVLGATLAGSAAQSLTALYRACRSTGLFDARLRYLLAAAVAAAALLAWYPYDVTLDVSTLSERTRLMRADPWLWPGSGELWSQGFWFFVIAALLAACLPTLNLHAAAVSAIVTVAMALLIDVGQLAMGHHPVGAASASAQAAGGAAGAVATSIITFSRRRTLAG